jgi:hypothetical protein
VSQSEDQAPKYKREAIAADRAAHLFDLGEQSVEVLTLRSFVLGQPSLHQTPQAKAVMVYTHDAATMRAFVVLM